MTPTTALAEFLRAQVTIAGCCRALEPLIQMARQGNAEAEAAARAAVVWMIKERK